MKIVKQTKNKITVEFSSREYLLLTEALGEFLHTYTAAKLRKISQFRTVLKEGFKK